MLNCETETPTNGKQEIKNHSLFHAHPNAPKQTSGMFFSIVRTYHIILVLLISEILSSEADARQNDKLFLIFKTKTHI